MKLRRVLIVSSALKTDDDIIKIATSSISFDEEDDFREWLVTDFDGDEPEEYVSTRYIERKRRMHRDDKKRSSKGMKKDGRKKRVGYHYLVKLCSAYQKEKSTLRSTKSRQRRKDMVEFTKVLDSYI